MRFPSKETVERIRREYPAGTRVELVRMDDAQAPPAGTLGTVLGVDDTGSLLMRWDNGSGLNVVYGEDAVRKADICPLCGRVYHGAPALSRVDNETPICSDCGTRQALRSIGVEPSEQELIIETIRRRTKE